MGKLPSTNQQLEIATKICDVLGIDSSEDDNLWSMLEYVDIEGISQEFEL